MYIKYKDIKLYYAKYGTGKKLLVILPGWGETKNSFLNLIELLRDEYTIYFIDYPGFGLSPFPNRDLTMDDYTKAVISFLDENKIKNFYLLAHSFGGRIAILLTGKYNVFIDRMILMNSAGIKPKTTLFKFLKNKLYKLLIKLTNILPKKKRQSLRNKIFKAFASTDYLELDEIKRNTFKNIVNLDLSSYLDKIKTETLLIWGENDTDTPLKDGIKLKKKIRDSELIVFRKTGHFSYLENTHIIINIIKEFFI